MAETGSDYDFDFAIAGGGPAGASAAISLAQRGHSVVLFERETFPRFHIGESLLATANDHFEALGVAEKIEQAMFPEKWGARLRTHDGQIGHDIDFSDVREVNQPKTYQVCREVFDQILIDHAREVGVHVREEHRVLAFDASEDAAIVEFAPAGLPAQKIRIRAMVDATGRAGLLASKLGLRKESEVSIDNPSHDLLVIERMRQHIAHPFDHYQLLHSMESRTTKMSHLPASFFEKHPLDL